MTDITSPTDVNHAFKNAVSVFGKVDVLVSSSGHLPTPTLFVDIPMND